MLPSGLVLNQRYRIESLLGQGGFGAVYYAYDQNLNGPCAIKENFDTSPQSQKQFAQEASMLFNLRHPHLPRVTDQFILPGQGQYLVMDFIEGQDLEEKLAENHGPLPEALILPWIAQVCDALYYLHSRTPAVIHRDVKPANIRISQDGAAYLVDFGVAKHFDPLVRTMTGARAVTPGYAPFEQYGQRRTDARSDIYALGATLYHLLTDQIPPESIDRVAGASLTPPRQLNPNISSSVEAAILHAMEIQPDNRFQSVAEFRASLFPPAASPPKVSLVHPPEQAAPSAPFPTPWTAASLAEPLPEAGLWSDASAVPASAAREPAQSPASGVARETASPETKFPKRRIAWGLLTVGIALAVLAALASTLLSTLAPAVAPTDASPEATEPAPAGVETAEVSLIPTLTDEWGAFMTLIPEGEFQMGSENGSDDEQPVHSVYLDAFYIDLFEVQNVYFATFLDENPDLEGSFTEWAQIDEEWFHIHDEGSGWHAVSGFEDFPVVGVTWYGAAAYCEWRGARLPTEAEWEKAARGGLEGAEYPWGDAEPICDQGEDRGAQFADCGEGLVEAGSYTFNGLGLADVAGNAWEWVADWYQSDYYAESPAEYPTGPESGDMRGLRGGGWNAAYEQLRVSYRERFDPAASDDYIGFRCAKTP